MTPTQSEILGIDTRRFSSVKDESGYFDKVKDFGSGILNVFDRGTEIFGRVAGRVSAMGQTAKEAYADVTPSVEVPKIVPPVKSSPVGDQVIQAVVIGVLTLLIVQLFRK